ncbi:MAG: glycosyltransferase [Bacteroidales bacterium]
MTEKPLVSIICDTFNHSKYIRNCLDGFINQKTSFPFEVLIHDDASTDNTADIIREYADKYPHIIKPIFQSENKYSKGVRIWFTYQFPRVNGKYIALCEGDDYWTDSCKLQKQIDFLEANPDYGLCHTKTAVYIQKTNQIGDETWGESIQDAKDLILNGSRICTLTTCFRTSLAQKFIKEVQNDTSSWKMLDYPMWIYLNLKSKSHFINCTTSVYRYLQESASHSDDTEKNILFAENTGEIKLYFTKKYFDESFHKEIFSNEFYKTVRNMVRYNHMKRLIWFKNEAKYLNLKDIYHLSSVLYFSSKINKSLSRLILSLYRKSNRSKFK